MRIIEAVFDRLRDAPAEPIAIDRIARDGGVARSTVYAIFGSRAGLFDAVGRELAVRSGYERLVDAKHQPDARDHLRVGLPCVRRDAGREPRHLPRAALDGAARRAGRRRRGRPDGRGAGRRDARLAGRLADQGVLRDGLGAADAEHILWVLTSFESFDLLTKRRLSTERAVELLIETAETLYNEV